MGNALPPGPRQSSFTTTWHWMRRPFEFLEEAQARYGDTFTIDILSLPPLVVFSHPDAVKEVFSDDGDLLHAGRFNQSLKAFLGDHSTLMLDGKEHLRHRRLLLPPFHGERMHAYGQPMLDVSDDIIDAWPRGRPFSLHEHMQSITVRVIVQNVLGIEDRRELDAVSATLAALIDMAAWPPLLIPAMRKDLGPWSPWGRFVRQTRAADAVLYDLIARRRREGTAGRRDVLSLLLDAKDDAGRSMTDAELRDELVTLLVAGHETTATALTWAIRWILATPSIARRLQEELHAAAGDAPAFALGPERIAKLELLDAVVREALRLQPVVPIVGRIIERPMRLGGYDLPAGVGVVCSIYLAQRRAAAYADPARFDPDRFLGKKPSPQEFFPFGGGIRRCIGMAFALYEMKMVLARTLARTRLRLADPDAIRTVRRSITLMPSDGLRVVLESRDPRARTATHDARSAGAPRHAPAAPTLTA